MLRNEATMSKIKLMRPLILKPKIFHTLGAVFVDWLLLCGVKETGSTFKIITSAINIEENLKKNLCNGITLSSFEKVDSMLKLGDLIGNEFRIVIRELQSLNEIIDNCESIKQFGYINYFGLQRFGSLNGTTHLIGREILKQQ